MVNTPRSRTPSARGRERSRGGRGRDPDETSTVDACNIQAQTEDQGINVLLSDILQTLVRIVAR